MGILSVVPFLLGSVFLFWMASLLLQGDERVVAQIELGVMACAFFLTAIYLKPGPKPAQKPNDY